MRRLPSGDLEALLAFVAEIYRFGDLSTFRPRMVRSLRALIPSDQVMCVEIDLRRQTMIGVSEPADALAIGPGLNYPRLVAQSPLLKSYRRGRGSAVKLSDFVTQSELRRTEIYNEYFRHVGASHQIAKGLPGPRGLITAVSFERSRVDFGERDRLILNLLRPHLNQGYRNAEALTRLRADLVLVERGVDALSRGLVMLTEDGRARSMTGRAREWLLAYFGSGRGGAAALPEPVARWLQGQRAGRHAVDRAQTPLVVERERSSLGIRYLRHGGDELLLLEEARREVDPVALESLGLSRREAEVLAWIIEGKTNGEIGTILGTSGRTIDKHVEHILRKLGVETRTAAVARTREVLRS